MSDLEMVTTLYLATNEPIDSSMRVSLFLNLLFLLVYNALPGVTEPHY